MIFKGDWDTLFVLLLSVLCQGLKCRVGYERLDDGLTLETSSEGLEHYNTVANCHLKRVLKSANPLILLPPLKRAIEVKVRSIFFM
jgi:hypothetical protein